MLAQRQLAKKRIPTYKIAELFPAQGEWSEAEYLALAADSNRIVELSSGNLEIHEMPTPHHQLIILHLISTLYPYVQAHKLGRVLMAPFPVRLWPGKFREPDLVFVSAAHTNRIDEKYWGVPDLAVEVISKSNVSLDRVKKMREYAQAGISEYWLVDPQPQTVEIYHLKGGKYALHENLKVGDALTSSQFPGFQLSLEGLFAEE